MRQSPRSYLQRVAKVPAPGVVSLTPRRTAFPARPSSVEAPAPVAPAAPRAAAPTPRPVQKAPGPLTPTAPVQAPSTRPTTPRKKYAPSRIALAAPQETTKSIPLAPAALPPRRGVDRELPPAASPVTPLPVPPHRATVPPQDAAPVTRSAGVPPSPAPLSSTIEIVERKVSHLETQTVVREQPTVLPLPPLPALHPPTRSALTPSPAIPAPRPAPTAPPQRPRLEIGTIEVHVSAPPAGPPVPRREPRRVARKPAPKAPLARGYFTNW